MTDTSGRTLPVPFGYYDRDTRSLKTSRITFDSASTLSSATLPKSGSMLSGTLYARTPLALRTSAAGSSSWPQLPTPRARDSRGRGFEDGLPNVVQLMPTPRTSDRNGVGAHGEGGPDLRTTIALLPTPNASDSKGSGATQGRMRNGRPRPLSDADLAEVAQLLPTPTTADGERSSATYPRGNPTLLGALLPTPTATDAKSSSGANPAWGHGETLTDADRSVGAGTARRLRGGRRAPAAPLPGQLTIEDG